MIIDIAANLIGNNSRKDMIRRSQKVNLDKLRTLFSCIFNKYHPYLRQKKGKRTCAQDEQRVICGCDGAGEAALGI